MRLNKRIKGVKMFSPGGGLIYCENCEKMVATINSKGYSFIEMMVLCTCGTCGFVRLSRKGKDYAPKAVRKMPTKRKYVSLCKKCGVPIFSVFDDRVRNYSFFAECVCGERYDVKSNFDRRLGETIDLFDKLKNEK